MRLLLVFAAAAALALGTALGLGFLRTDLRLLGLFRGGRLRFHRLSLLLLRRHRLGRLLLGLRNRLGCRLLRRCFRLGLGGVGLGLTALLQQPGMGQAGGQIAPAVDNTFIGDKIAGPEIPQHIKAGVVAHHIQMAVSPGAQQIAQQAGQLEIQRVFAAPADLVVVHAGGALENFLVHFKADGVGVGAVQHHHLIGGAELLQTHQTGGFYIFKIDQKGFFHCILPFFSRQSRKISLRKVPGPTPFSDAAKRRLPHGPANAPRLCSCRRHAADRQTEWVLYIPLPPKKVGGLYISVSQYPRLCPARPLLPHFSPPCAGGVPML